MNFYSKQTS